VTAKQIYELLGLTRPPGVATNLKAKWKKYEHNTWRTHSMLSRHATERAQLQFPAGELSKVLKQVADIEHEQQMRQKYARSAVLGKRKKVNKPHQY
jgi:hypothetical protein